MPPYRIIDAQLHEPSIWLDWDDADDATRHRLLAEATLAATGAVGVEGAVLFPAFDEEWAEKMAAQFPDRFGWVAVANDFAEEPDVDDRLVQPARERGLVGWRVMLAVSKLRPNELERYRSGAFDRIFAVCEEQEIPVFTFATEELAVADEIATRYPGLVLVVDHFGLPQQPLHERDDPPFAALPELLALARHPNVAVKFSGAILYSDVPYPHGDLWPHLRQVVDTFGPERLLWASDISRIRGRIGLGHHPVMPDYPGRHTYAEALHLVRDTDQLSEAEKELILGGALRRLLRFPRSEQPSPESPAAAAR